MKKNEDGTFTLTEQELAVLVANTAEARNLLYDVYVLRDNIMRVCKAFKLTTPDGKRIRPTIIDKTENPVMSLCKGGIETLGLLTSASIGIESSAKEIEERFGFLGNLGPILSKYGGKGEELLALPGFQNALGGGNTKTDNNNHSEVKI